MTKNDWIEVARLALTSRHIDLIEEEELRPAGKITYQFSARGHELPQILLGRMLDHKHDGASVYYRSRPFVLAAGMTIREALAGPLGSRSSRNGGRDIGVVHNLTPRRGVTIMPASGDVGAQFTPAVGWAQAVDYRSNVMKEEEWQGALGVALAGDAATATNGFWAALNIATTLNLPYIFFIEDNGYGISVGSHLQTPGGNIAANLHSFNNLNIIDIDGTDPKDAAYGVERAVEHARARKSPVLLRARVPRICGHSFDDNQSYKSEEQMKDENARDPLSKLESYLARRRFLSKSRWQELEAEVKAEVKQVAEECLAEGSPDPSSARLYMFCDGKIAQKVGGMLAENVNPPKSSNIEKVEDKRRVNMVDAIRMTLEGELEKNQRVLVFGEDVGPKGGVHGATIDLSNKFGQERVFDTSLSEEGIIGRSVGMAMAGLVPVPEIQFRKYADPATEQINDCGTIRWRSNNDFAAPMVVRIPVGTGKRTGDPWHSVSGEAIFAHTPGWRIAMPSNARDAAGLLRSALRGNDPTLFLEHRALLDTSPGRTPWPGDDFTVPFGKANVVRGGSAATIVSWGEMVSRCEKVVDKLGVDVEILDLRTLIPWDREAVLASVRKTNRCMVVHEDGWTCGFGAEVAATVAQDTFGELDAPVERVATPDIPIPYNPELMEVVVPGVAEISARLQALLDF